jgi:arylsulfatase A-like enzyme
MSKQSNVLFITCDQLRKDTLGLYGNRVIRTPNIGAVFERGAIFDSMYCASPVCAPNRHACRRRP